MSDQYILDENGTPQLCDDLTAWAEWMESHNDKRIVQQDKVGDAKVSTVFLGLDHNFSGGAPILWETMIFGGPNDGYQERYDALSDAVAGHQRALELVMLNAPVH